MHIRSITNRFRTHVVLSKCLSLWHCWPAGLYLVIISIIPRQLDPVFQKRRQIHGVVFHVRLCVVDMPGLTYLIIVLFTSPLNVYKSIVFSGLSLQTRQDFRGKSRKVDVFVYDRIWQWKSVFNFLAVSLHLSFQNVALDWPPKCSNWPFVTLCTKSKSVMYCKAVSIVWFSEFRRR